MTAKTLPYPLLLLLLTLLVALLAALSMLVGPAGAGTFALIDALGGDDRETAWMILREVRLPRTLLAIIVGATMGASGAALQGLLRNPLADPGVIGVSSAASLGAVLALYTGLSAVFPLALPVSAILAATLSVAVLLGLAGRGGSLTLILAGVAISSLCAALSALALNLSPNPYAAMEIMFWLMGSVTDRSLEHVALALPFVLAGWLLLALAARPLEALTLGEDSAASLGVDLSRTRLLIVSGSALSVGASTAVTGGIGFVGLMAPHILRPLVGYSPSRLLAASALGGAALLTTADIVIRLAPTSSELKLGVITALLGAPFFLMLVLHARRSAQ